MRILKGIDDIALVHFDEKDIVRHKLVRDIVNAYEKHQAEQEARRKAKTDNETN